MLGQSVGQWIFAFEPLLYNIILSEIVKCCLYPNVLEPDSNILLNILFQVNILLNCKYCSMSFCHMFCLYYKLQQMLFVSWNYYEGRLLAGSPPVKAVCLAFF